MEGSQLPHWYDDIIDLPHWQSPTRPRMSRMNRAAQFAPFAALAGHDVAIQETGRLTDTFKELDESRKAELDEKLRCLVAHLHEEPMVTITYFRPDGKKDGGAYLSAAGVVREINEYEMVVTMREQVVIPFERIFEIEIGSSVIKGFGKVPSERTIDLANKFLKMK